MVLRALHNALVSFSHAERRLEPFFRAPLDALLRDPQAALIQALINLGRRRDGLALAEERLIPDEAAHIQSIIDTMRVHMNSQYHPGDFKRAGNTKTHGVLRGEVTIRDDVPARMRHGILAEPRSYRAWVRYSGPGPDRPPDIDDVGFVSMTIKMMGVPGPKLLDDEKFTQDLLGICTPTFVTPDARANAKLQVWSYERTPLWYFFDPRDSHLLDFWMQALWNKTQSNPLGEQYFSCVPYLLGDGQAMQYAFYPKTTVKRHIPGLPLGRPPDNYLRDNMIATLKETDVEFDIMVQVQTDAFRMPIENASVLWPQSLSPRVPVASLRIPMQSFDSPAQFAFAGVLSYNPWHCLPEHRPLGNQSRTRLPLYTELSRYRQAMNRTPHIEPTGDEVFP